MGKIVSKFLGWFGFRVQQLEYKHANGTVLLKEPLTVNGSLKSNAKEELSSQLEDVIEESVQ